MKEELLALLERSARAAGVESPSIQLGYPEDPSHGDFTTNAALAYAKAAKMSPRALAEKIAAEAKKSAPAWIASIDVAGPGFVNVKVSDAALAEAAVAPHPAAKPSGRKVMVEYTDPNPFKEFHIGHLMSNAIGESISRLIASTGAKVIRANWQGDVGPHVAKALWGARHMKEREADFKSAVAYWGAAYAFGAKAYDEDEAAKAEIQATNKKIYDRSDPELNALYDDGRRNSLEAFDRIYARLGTKFDNYFFEGTEGRNGEAVVRDFMKKGVFEESEGAIVFKGEAHGLHTRVFITSQGLPTYEAKELGLNREKFRLYPDLDESIIVTASEQSDYFKVLLKVFSLIDPKIAECTRHVSHGMMRFASGKMSSRKGNVITAEALIDDVKASIREKMAGREFGAEEADEIADAIAIAAIKYSILRQAPGGDVIFDPAKSISFEGDSGPYLQYSAVRANSVLEKAKALGLAGSAPPGAMKMPETIGLLERLLVRFGDIADRAAREYAPQHVAGYLIQLAGAFNSFYAGNPIADPAEPLSPYRIALTKSFLATMTDGLSLLGIKVPRKM